MFIVTRILIGLLVLLPMRSTTLAAADKPHVVLLQPIYDFETVEQGEKVEHDFLLRNDGTSSLAIELESISAPGMTVRFDKHIAPGGDGRVSVDWNTARATGEVEATVVLRLNDPDRPNIALMLKGAIVPPIAVRPYPAVFFSVFEGETAERSVIVMNNQERPVSISRLEPVGEHFEATVETLEAGRSYEVKVTVPPNEPPGRYREAILVHTDDPVHSQLRIAVNVLVKSDVYVNPEDVAFGYLRLGSVPKNPDVLPLLTQTFLVKRRSGEMAITAVETDLPFLEIVREPEGRAQTFRFDVTPNPERIEPGAVDGSIRIETDDPEFPVLIVPVTGHFE